MKSTLLALTYLFTFLMSVSAFALPFPLSALTARDASDGIQNSTDGELTYISWSGSISDAPPSLNASTSPSPDDADLDCYKDTWIALVDITVGLVGACNQLGSITIPYGNISCKSVDGFLTSPWHGTRTDAIVHYCFHNKNVAAGWQIDPAFCIDTGSDLLLSGCFGSKPDTAGAYMLLGPGPMYISPEKTRTE